MLREIVGVLVGGDDFLLDCGDALFVFGVVINGVDDVLMSLSEHLRE